METIGKKDPFYWKTSFPYVQGPQGRQIRFSLQCYNIPVGSTVAMSADVEGPVPPIYLAPTVVSTHPAFTIGIVVNVPDNYESNINFELSCNEKPPADSSVTCLAGYFQEPHGESTSAGGPAKLIVVAKVITTN
jgi:hypothetical protein